MRNGEYVVKREAMAAEITLANTDRLKGRLWIPIGKSLGDILNSTHPFVEFSHYGDERICYFAKSQIISVSPLDIPASVTLDSNRGSEDPYLILSVERGATLASIREAYIKLAKIYHPDRFSGVALPREVHDYLGSMLRKINAAYALLDDSSQHPAGQA